MEIPEAADRAEVVLLGADDEARVRMPRPDEQRESGFAPDEPVVEIWR